MEAAGIALAVAGTSELCLKYGRELRDRYRSYKHAEQEIQEAILYLETHWVRIEEKIRVLRRIWASLEKSLQEIQDRVLHVLQNKLHAGVLRIKRLGPVEPEPSLGRRRRALYAASVKESLAKINTDLERWQSTFDPSFFLISRMRGADIDKQLSGQATKSKDLSILKHLRDTRKRNAMPLSTPTSIFISSKKLKGDRISIPHCQAELVSNSGKHALIDTVFLPNMSSDEDKDIRDVRDLARTLREANPKIFGLLQCRGAAKCFDGQGKLTHFDFVFNVPTGLRQPNSLRGRLLTKDVPPPLDDRFKLAKSLARSVAYVHTCNFVHKSIRPDTVIIFKEAGSVLGPSFLVGFEKFRPADRGTRRHGDALWEMNLYRHPRRQGINPEEDYKMQHDIYSLGVCLLEIGLWSSFVVPTSDGARVGGGLNISSLLLPNGETSRALKVKTVLANTATTRLPSCMGKRYTEVVMRCLTCLDKDNGFGDEADFRDEDGIKVGVRYIEKVLGELEKISL